MPVYQYKASDQNGQTQQGTIEAENENAAAARLQQMGCTPIYLSPVKAEDKAVMPVLQRRGVKFADLNMFTRQLFTLQRAGLPLVRSLNAIIEQAASLGLKKAMTQMVRDIEAGSTFSAALEKHPAVFNPIYVNMVRSGEVSGRLVETLERLAVLGEHDERIRMKIQGALRYPLIVVVGIIVGFLILITMVVPRFAKLYGSFDAELPLPTRMLLGIEYAVSHFWWLLLILTAALVFAARAWVKTPPGRQWWDSVCLKIPIFGPLTLKMILSRFCRMTGTLIESGVPILQILALVAESVDNAVVSRAVAHLKQSVSEGRGMSGPMKQSGLFPPIVVQMVSVGEETGKLDELLVHVSDYYDEQIDYTIANLVSLIEPFLIFVLGGAVLFMALGIFLPMWDMMRLFKH